MAETWIKIRHALLRSPKIRQLARQLNCNKNEALGVAVAWLMWVDEQSADGETFLTPAELDEEIGSVGAIASLVAIGWAVLNEDGTVAALEFGKHCGASAKRRAQDASRLAEKRNVRKMSASKADKNTTNVGKMSASKADKNTTKSGQNSDKCPQNVRFESGQNYDQRREEKNIIGSNSVPNNTTVVLSDDSPKKARSGKTPPESADEVRAFMAGYGLCSLTGDELTNCAAGFFDEMEASGWTTRNGAPVFDWHALARKYCRSWQLRSASAAIADRKSAQPVVYRSDRPQNYDL